MTPTVAGGAGVAQWSRREAASPEKAALWQLWRQLLALGLPPRAAHESRCQGLAVRGKQEARRASRG